MYVITRSGEKEPMKFDKISERVEQLCFDLDRNFIDPTQITKKVIEGIYDGITTKELDQLTAETAAYLATQHPHYSVLAGALHEQNISARRLSYPCRGMKKSSTLQTRKTSSIHHRTRIYPQSGGKNLTTLSYPN